MEKEFPQKDLPPFFKAQLYGKLPPLSLYIPLTKKTMPPIYQGLIGVTGILFGALFLRPLFFSMGFNQSPALFFSCIVGSFLFIFTTARSSKVQERLFSYFGLQEESMERDELALSMEKTLSIWISFAQHIIQEEKGRMEKDREFLSRKDMKGLITAIYRLQESSKEDLDVAVLNLFTELKLLGYEGLEEGMETDQYIYWKEEYKDEYDTYGLLTEGQRGKIEKPAIRKNGQVIERGLLRRVPEKSTQKRCQK